MLNHYGIINFATAFELTEAESLYMQQIGQPSNALDCQIKWNYFRSFCKIYCCLTSRVSINGGENMISFANLKLFLGEKK